MTALPQNEPAPTTSSSVSHRTNLARFTCRTPQFTYSPLHEPLGVVAPGERFEVETVDCFSGLYQDPAGFTPEHRAYTRENLDGVTGPISVRDAAIGDVVAVTIHGIEITTPGSVVVSRYRDPSPRGWWLEEDACYSYPIENGELVFSNSLRIPVRPLIGCIATAPGRETVLSIRQGPYGGNIDCAEVTVGATVVLPVAVEGALLYFGDCKALMGDGEITQPPEVGTLITASVAVRPRPPAMRWPRVETPESLVTVVSNPSLDEACRFAFKELLDWVESEYDIERTRAAMLLGMVAQTGICQTCNSLYTAKCVMPRRWVAEITGS